MRIRPDLASAPGYVPGKSIPGSIKLASNESPFGPLPSVADALSRQAELLNRYPDPAGLELTAALAAQVGVAPENIVLGNGSVTLLQHLIQATCSPGQSVVSGWRSFEAYPLLARNVAAEFAAVPLADEAMDLGAMLAEVLRLEGTEHPAGIVLVCNPNNPTSTTVGRAALTAFLDALPRDLVVVLDEAYREFAGEDFADGLTLLRRADGSARENVVVLRTFSKAYGLAGLRIGYGIGSPQVVNAVKTVTLPFSVNMLAQAAALACLTPEAQSEMRQRVKETVVERARLTEALHSLGLPVPHSESNFVWLPTGEDTAALDTFLQDNRLVARPFPGEGLRVTISTPEENDAFLRAMTAWVARP